MYHFHIPNISHIIIGVVVVWICCRCSQFVDAVCFRSFDYVKLFKCSGVKNNNSLQQSQISYSVFHAIADCHFVYYRSKNCEYAIVLGGLLHIGIEHWASDDITFGTYFGIWIFPWVESSEKWKTAHIAFSCVNETFICFNRKIKIQKRNEMKWNKLDWCYISSTTFSGAPNGKWWWWKNIQKSTSLIALKFHGDNRLLHSIWHSKNEQNGKKRANIETNYSISNKRWTTIMTR